jgi:exosome complex RNA-binding protein Csl4
MQMYELCGLTEEEAKEEEKIIKAYVNGRTILDANDKVMEVLNGGEQTMKRSIYGAYIYGVMTGLYIREQEMLEKFNNMIQTIKQR